MPFPTSIGQYVNLSGGNISLTDAGKSALTNYLKTAPAQSGDSLVTKVGAGAALGSSVLGPGVGTVIGGALGAIGGIYDKATDASVDQAALNKLATLPGVLGATARAAYNKMITAQTKAQQGQATTGMPANSFDASDNGLNQMSLVPGADGQTTGWSSVSGSYDIGIIPIVIIVAMLLLGKRFKIF